MGSVAIATGRDDAASIPCMAPGLLFTAGLFLFMAAYIFPEWQAGWPGLVFWTAISLLIIDGTWLWDEVHEIRRGRSAVPLFPK
jgi:hypothetical protein